MTARIKASMNSGFITLSVNVLSAVDSMNSIPALIIAGVISISGASASGVSRRSSVRLHMTK
jgi:hypothetical protein